MKSQPGESPRTLNSLLIQQTCLTFSLPRSAALPPGATWAWKVTCSNCVNQPSVRAEGAVVKSVAAELNAFHSSPFRSFLCTSELVMSLTLQQADLSTRLHWVLAQATDLGFHTARVGCFCSAPKSQCVEFFCRREDAQVISPWATTSKLTWRS